MKQEKQNQSLDMNEALSQSEAFVVKHKKSLIIGITAFVVLVGGFFAVQYGFLKPREEKAQTLLALGQNYFAAGEWDKALNGDGNSFPGYVKIAKDYSFTDAANLAQLYSGLCYANKGEVKEAIAALEAFSPENDVTVSPTAIAALANCYASDNQLDKAVATFKKAADMADNASLSPVFLIEAGKLLESQKKYDEALKLYNEVKNEYSNSVQATPSPQNGKLISAEIDKYIERATAAK